MFNLKFIKSLRPVTFDIAESSSRRAAATPKALIKCVEDKILKVNVAPADAAKSAIVKKNYRTNNE